MRDDTRSNTGVAQKESVKAHVEVEVHGRWNALALSEILASYHSFLVHHERDRWIVHARAPGCHGESLDDALRTIDAWLLARGLDGSSCRVGGRQGHVAEGERT
jgi:hypothetical protein